MRSKTSFLLTKFMTQKFKFSYSWVRVCLGCCMWNINKKGTVSQENDDGTHCAVRTESRNGKYVPSRHWQFGKFLLCPYLKLECNEIYLTFLRWLKKYFDVLRDKNHTKQIFRFTIYNKSLSIPLFSPSALTA